MKHTESEKKGRAGDEIEMLLTRGVERIYPSKEFLEARLRRGEKVSLYLGVDPTGSTLHLGHAIPLRKLRDFQKLGCKVVLLIGDFTGMIGDPTDKAATRKRLTREEVLANSALYKEQASKYLDFGGANPAELRYNSEWLGKMSFGDVVELSSHMTVQQMLERDMFANRMKEGKPIHLHEFLYPLMQGYDSVAMDVDGEIGGNDQTFNMLAGRTLMKQMKDKEKFVLTAKLLADQSGKKMGKTEGNMLAFSDSPSEMFGKVMSWTDGMILSGFELCTDVPDEEIMKIDASLKAGVNPKDAKVRLAKEIVAFYHGASAADEAEKGFAAAFAQGGMPADAPEVTIASGASLWDAISQAGLVDSKTDLRRLVDEGAISEIGGEDKKISEHTFAFTRDMDLKIGKRRFLKVRIQK